MLAAQIEALGALLQADKQIYRKEIYEVSADDCPQKKKTYGNVLKKLLKVTSLKTADPIVLTAICNFAHELFECDDIIRKPKKMQ